jgi:8-amino-7-oxononanoate synthase
MSPSTVSVVDATGAFVDASGAFVGTSEAFVDSSRLPVDAFKPTRVLVKEKIIAYLRDELQMAVGEISDDAPLSQLGIDSLGIASIHCELEQATRKRVNPDAIYELNSVAELAEYLDSLPIATEATKPNGLAKSTGSQAMTSSPATQVDANGRQPDRDRLLDHYRLLNGRVQSLKDAGTYFFEPVISEHDGAWVVADGQRMLMLSSYEYLGLLGHPHLKRAAIAAIEKFGTGHHGVRLLAGTTTLHRQLEDKLAQWMRAEAAIVYSSGFMTNLATISALVDCNCCVIGDAWNHASIVDGCRASGAEFLVFDHNDMRSLREKLMLTGGRRTLVVVDAVFSMDGDIINLPKVVDLCRQYNALLMVDEAHSLGVLGETGHGIQEHFDLPDDAIDIKMGTLSKTLASCGGFVAGREEIITFLKHHARGYIFSGALPTAQTATAIAALEVIEREPKLVADLRANVEYYVRGLKRLGFDIGNTVTAVVPVMTRNEELTLEMTRLCRANGLFVVPVAFPAVPLNAPRLRTCVSALHGQPELDFALQVLAAAGRRTGLIE